MVAYSIGDHLLKDGVQFHGNRDKILRMRNYRMYGQKVTHIHDYPSSNISEEIILKLLKLGTATIPTFEHIPPK